MFMKRKLNYTQEKLLKKMPKEYYSEIKIFIKQNTDILLNHRSKDYSIKLFKDKQALFIRNYKSLSK